MKRSIVVYVFVLCLATVNALVSSPRNTSYDLAEKVLLALKEESPTEFSRLLPTTAELCQLLEENKSLYGPFLLEAKADLIERYEANVLPQMEESFETVIEDGRRKGIVWNEIQLDQVEVNESKKGIKILFRHHNAHYQILLEKVMLIGGEWKATQFIELV